MSKVDFFDEDIADEDYECWTCTRCWGRGYIVICIDDLCANSDHCMHGDGEVICPDCDGEGWVYQE